MGQDLTRKKKVKEIDLIPPKKCFDYHIQAGEIIFGKDNDLHIIKLEIRYEYWFTSTVRLWLKRGKAKKFNILRSRSSSLKSSCEDQEETFFTSSILNYRFFV